MRIHGKPSSSNNPDVKWALNYTSYVLILNLLSQLVTGNYSVQYENAFILLIFAFLSIVNNVMLTFFWAYAGIPGVDGLSPFGEEGEEVVFDVSATVGWCFSITFTTFLVLELLLIKPAYDKLCWNTFQQIGSDAHIQICYQNFEVAKGSWILLFWFSCVEFGTVLFFEDNRFRFWSFIVVAVIYSGGLIFGFIGVRNYPIYN